MRARFQLYKTADLQNNWLLEEENDDQIQFINRQQSVEITVTSQFKFTFQTRNNKTAFVDSDIEIEAMERMLRYYESGLEYE